MRNPSDIIDDANELLRDPLPVQPGQYAVSPYQTILPPEEPMYPPMNLETPTEMFETLPEDLRNDAIGINFYSAKRKLVATLVEALEQAMSRYKSTNSPEAGLLVGSISNQVQRTLKDLEKSQDPRILYEQIEDEIFNLLTDSMVQSVSSEMGRLVHECAKFVPQDKQQAFIDTVKLAAKRVGPLFDEQLDEARKKLKLMLNIKEKRILKDADNDSDVPGL